MFRMPQQLTLTDHLMIRDDSPLDCAERCAYARAVGLSCLRYQNVVGQTSFRSEAKNTRT
jgi:hypothetical protein